MCGNNNNNNNNSSYTLVALGLNRQCVLHRYLISLGGGVGEDSQYKNKTTCVSQVQVQ